MDMEYWDRYYKKRLSPSEPSQFAYDILKYLKRDKLLLDLGCGNGRDSIFFIQNGINVIGIDQSKSAIDDLNIFSVENKQISFIQDDFVTSKFIMNKTFDYVYSRFTLHSISSNEETLVLKNVHKSLKQEGKLFIEVRSINDDIYGKGKCIGVNEYIYNGHYRRFIIMDELVKKLLRLNYNIVYSSEEKNFARYKNENPTVIRIIAEK